ncbi:MAG TPA: ATP-binding protein, partial [Burkholderiaceae bacterium]
MSQYFARTELASQMAKQLIHPDVLSEGLRSGLFISGQRRTGKTTFLLHDLVPALEQEGALVIYVDLWSDTNANPAKLVREAIRSTLEQLQTPGSALLGRLKAVAGAEIGVMGFKLGLKLDKLGEPDGETLAQVIIKLIDQVKRDVVLIIDEVQQAITTDDGNQLLLALKAARDAVNPRPGTPGHFLFIGTGSHRAGVNELTTRRNQAFNGATSIAYPVLDADYVDHVMKRMADAGAKNLPSREIAIEAFRTLGNRPEELIKALR